MLRIYPDPSTLFQNYLFCAIYLDAAIGDRMTICVPGKRDVGGSAEIVSRIFAREIGRPASRIR